jgi:ABC-type multidrug transport system ATPase subunit
MYTYDDNKYKFEFSLESEQLAFSITYGDGTAFNIDWQSAGFKWFFNFYINFLSNNDLKPGDIVVIDDQTAALHVRAQVELRNFIKEFAKESGISFIIATHSPFMIDVDNLDELRIIKRDGKKSEIINNFSLQNDGERDTLFNVLSSLSIGRHILLDPNKILIFVEGVTDYNYLVAFKKYFNKDNLSFLPINGLKDKKLHTKLLDIYKNPILLVDNDEAGKIAIGQNAKKKNKIEIHTLAEVNGNFKTIEDLFTDIDRESIKKSYTDSCTFKNSFDEIVLTLSEETKENFKRLLETLEI